MFTTVITDCWGENEKGRQIARYNSLGLGPTDLIGVGSNFSNDATIEGGSDLIDILDATEGKKGVVVLNVAPRGDKNEGTNGNNFSFFYYKKTLVISSVKGYSLSQIKKFEIADHVNVVELAEVLKWSRENKLINKDFEKYIVQTQFRSFDFVPRLVRWLIDGHKVPSKILELKTYNLPPHCVWHVDAFGNAKLTITSKDLLNHHPEFTKKFGQARLISGPKVPKQVRNDNFNIKTNIGLFPFYKRLKDVPHGETAIYIGSSGLGDERFLEIATQGIPGSAAKSLNLKIGDTIEIK